MIVWKITPRAGLIRGRTGGYYSGFRLDLTGDAADEYGAVHAARVTTDAWLAAKGITATVTAAKIRPRRR